MDICIVTATALEIKPLLSRFRRSALWKQESDTLYRRGKLQVEFVLTGPGLMHTAFALGHYLSKNKPDLLIGAGIAGAFDPKLELGKCYVLRSETLGDLAIEQRDGSLEELFSIGLLDPQVPPFQNGRLWAPGNEALRFLESVDGLTVQTVSGSAERIASLRKRFPYAQVESMESAAFFYACLQAQKPFVALRAISNYVEPRNREAWKLEEATEQLALVLEYMLESLL